MQRTHSNQNALFTRLVKPRDLAYLWFPLLFFDGSAHLTRHAERGALCLYFQDTAQAILDQPETLRLLE
jgi:hypothetical protein